MKVFVVVFVLIFVFVSSLLSQSRWVLAIGISEYTDNNITSLKYCHRDAQALAEYFKKDGVPSSQIQVLVNENATKENILNALRDIKNKISFDAQFVFFISGHGSPDPDNPNKHYFLTSDTTQGYPDTALDMKQVKEEITKMRIKEAVMLVDTCHSGGAKSGNLKNQDLDGAFKNTVITRIQEVRIAILASSRTYEKSIEKDSWQHGAFTYSILQGLSGRADEDRDGKISVVELTDFVEMDVRKLTRRGQNPTSHFSGHWNTGSVFGSSLGKPDTPEPSAPSNSDRKWVSTSEDGRFKVDSVGIILDQETGMEWLVGPNRDATYTFAETWVASLSKWTYGDGWRMPTKLELKKLYCYGKGTRNIDPVFKTLGWFVWAEIKDSSSAWYVIFENGGEHWDYREGDGGPRVFAVRVGKQ